MPHLYQESQKINQWWVWLIMLGVVGISLYAGISTYLAEGSIMSLLVGAGVGILMAVLFAILTLKTTITEDGIDVGFGFLGNQRIFKSEIEDAYVREYSPIGEYGGWGIRHSTNGKAFNVSGNQGLQLELKNGKTLMIGTQRPEELAAVMANYLADRSDDQSFSELPHLNFEEFRLKQKQFR